MTINEIGIIFMLWWITMGVVTGLWCLINEKKQAEELYKRSYSFMTFEEWLGKLYLELNGAFNKAPLIFATKTFPIIEGTINLKGDKNGKKA